MTSAIGRLKRRKSEREQADGDGPRQTIFLVDDERPNLDALVRVLRKRYSVTVFESGAAALDAIGTDNCPDLIITDQRMPGMTGVELLDAIGTSQPQSVGIVLSGFTERKDLVGAVNTGRVFSYVTKPWQPKTLLDTITAALEHSEKRQEEAAIAEGLKKLGSQFDDLSGRLEEMTTSLDLLTP